MDEVIYFDRFTKEYTNIKENFAPPDSVYQEILSYL